MAIKKLYKGITVVAGGGTDTLSCSDPNENYILFGSPVTLTSNYTIDSIYETTGSVLTIYIKQAITANGNTITILGNSYTRDFSNCTITAVYDGSWKVNILEDVKSLTVSKDVSATASGSNLEFSVLKGTSSTANSVKGGLIMAKTIYSAQVKPLLDTGTHNLMPISLGDDVLEVRAFVQTAAGTTGVIFVGFDAASNGGVADTDGLLLDADGAVAGVYSSIDPALTYQGASMAFGEWTAADGYLTITSGHDLTASAIVVNIVVIYRSK